MSTPSDILAHHSETLAHHSEAIDPTLWEWISHRIDEIFGFSPLMVVAAIGSLSILMPLALIAVVTWHRRRIKNSQ